MDLVPGLSDEPTTRDRGPGTRYYLPMAFHRSALVCGVAVVCTEI